MRRAFLFGAVLLLTTSTVHAHGILIPADKTVPPLAMVNHKVNISINDQVAVTQVEQLFRNHTDRPLEATYVFPVPRGASVNKFTMWVDGKEVGGEMVEAAKARQIYTDIVRRTLDPGLLEYLGSDLLQMKVFPVPARGEQRVALSFTAVAQRDRNLVEYIYPLKTDGKATRTLEDFSIKATVKSQHPIVNVYSPTHAITLNRSNDREVTITFEKNQALLDKDFQLFYSIGDKDVDLTLLTNRPLSSENGYFMMLLSPRLELSKSFQVPRDLVLVLDTSGSMAGDKITQAKKALQYVLTNLNPQDRFAVVNFSTTVSKYRDSLMPSDAEHIDHAKKWVDNLRAAGGTAINDALAAALEMRSQDAGRTFTIVFFTDGQPTIGETNPEKILKNVEKRNTANTRIFTFGVGEADGINASMLDQLADQTRALSTFVRPAEDIEAKVSSLYDKISHPVLANLKLSVGEGVRLEEVYPPQLPDLFHGSQLVVLGRYSGKGPVAVKLNGQVGMEGQEFVYEVSFPDKTSDDRAFVEHVWARRKVGYLLDQIRVNGEKKELVDEVVTLAKKYGITTPYTSYLIVPDGPVPVAGRPGGGGVPVPLARPMPTALAPVAPGASQVPVAEFARRVQEKPGELAANRGKFEDERLNREAQKAGDGKGDGDAKNSKEAFDKKQSYEQAYRALQLRDQTGVQTGKLGVDLSVHCNNLRCQTRLEQTAQRNVYGRNCMEIGGVWIDETFDPKMKVLTVKAQSDAWFRLLERNAKMKDVLQLGNHLVWCAPNGTALVIDTQGGKEQLADAEIDELFVAQK